MGLPIIFSWKKGSGQKSIDIHLVEKKEANINLVKKKNCGAFFQWNDNESLKFSLENFIKNYQHFNEKSIIASRDWHKSEGIQKFCKFIVNKI